MRRWRILSARGWALISVGVAVGLSGYLWRLGGGDRTLLVYCAVSASSPMTRAVEEYERVSGTKVQVQYGGSGMLLANAQLSGTGDLFMPADEDYLRLARERGLVDEVFPLATMRPVIAVRKGNPKGIRGVEDLLRSGMRLSEAGPSTAAIGRVVREAIGAGRWEGLRRNMVVEKPSVSDAMVDVQAGMADAAFSWDVVVGRMPELEAVVPPELAGVRARFSAGILRSTRERGSAMRFVEYLRSETGGLRWFRENGYRAVTEVDRVRQGE